MAKSKIIKDLANGNADVPKALKRLKVLVCELGDSRITSWVNNELTGYPNIESVPEYRKTQGILFGTFLTGNRYNLIKYTDCPLPIAKVNNDIRDDILTVSVTDSVSSINHLINSGKELGRSIPPEVFYILQQGTTISSIVSATVKVNVTFFQDILAKVESILIDVLLTLEKEFGVLDDLDIDLSEDVGRQERIIQQLTQYIFIDNSVSIGDNNKIKDSTITSE